MSSGARFTARGALCEEKGFVFLSNLIIMASILVVVASTLVAMASNRRAMASILVVYCSVGSQGKGRCEVHGFSNPSNIRKGEPLV